MNTYSKYIPHVFLAKCSEQHSKGDIIEMETKYGDTHECTVFNLIQEKTGFFYYSVVRTDGFNYREWANRRAAKLHLAAINAAKKSNDYFNRSNKHSDFLRLFEPIKIGHHSENRHRKMIRDSQNNMGKSVEFSKKSEDYASRMDYWERKADTINLSMPESLEFYEFQLEKAINRHEGLKNGTIERDHGYSLTYAKKYRNEIENKLKLAELLWGGSNDFEDNKTKTIPTKGTSSKESKETTQITIDSNNNSEESINGIPKYYRIYPSATIKGTYLLVYFNEDLEEIYEQNGIGTKTEALSKALDDGCQEIPMYLKNTMDNDTKEGMMNRVNNTSFVAILIGFQSKLESL